MSEILRREEGVSKPMVSIGVAAVVLAGAFGFNRLTNDDNEAAADSAADTTAESYDWADVDGGNHKDCIDLATEAGTAEIGEFTVGEDKYQIVMPDFGYKQEGRLWTNSMRAPFESDNPEAEVKAALCEDPAFAVATANVLGNFEYNGQRLADTEEGAWLAPYADIEAEELDDKAEYLSGYGTTTEEESYARYQEFTELAANLSAVLDNLNYDGVKTGATLVDVTYSDGTTEGNGPAWVDVDNAGIPEMEATKNQFEDAEAVMFGVLNKGDDCSTNVIGFNTGIGADGDLHNGDMRPETFKDVCIAPEQTTTTTDTPTTRPPRTIPEEPTTTTTVPETTTTVPETTTTTGVPKVADKDPHGESPSTTVEAPKENVDENGNPTDQPQTSTTTSSSTSTTQPARTTTSTTEPQSGDGGDNTNF